MTVDLSKLNGVLKVRYPKGVDKAPFACDKFRKATTFETKSLLGKSMNIPVLLQESQGATYAGPAEGAYTLNDPVSLQIEESVVTPYQISFRESIATNAIEQAMKKGDQAVDTTVSLSVDSVLRGHSKRLDEQLFYGQKGLGQVAQGTVTTEHSATSDTVTIVAAEFAAGIWAASNNRQINFYTTGGVLVSTGADAIFTVTSVDITARTVRVTGTATGISDLETALASSALNIFEKGAYGKEMLGVEGILTTADKFEIDGATYPLWNGNVHSVGGALTQAAVDAGIAKAVNAGGLDEEITLWINPKTWVSLASNINSATRWEGGRVRTTAGTTVLKFLSQNGVIEVTPYNMVKEGVAYGLPMANVVRYGAVDLDFDQFSDPKTGSNIAFYMLQDAQGVGFRTRSNQALYIHYPAKAVKFSGISN